MIEKRGKRPKVLQPRATRHGYLKPLPERKTGGTELHKSAVERNREILEKERPETQLSAPVLYQQAVQNAPPELNDVTKRVARQRYAALETRKELAASILASGGTYAEAANHAGVSPSTVAKYLEDVEFRARIEERRAVVRNRVGGRIEQWMDRVTGQKGRLELMAPKDVLAIYDRVAVPLGERGRGGSGAGAEPPSVVVNSYTAVMDRLGSTARPPEAGRAVDDAGAQGGAFPVVVIDGAAMAGGVPPGDGEVPRSGPRETRG